MVTLMGAAKRLIVNKNTLLFKLNVYTENVIYMYDNAEQGNLT